MAAARDGRLNPEHLLSSHHIAKGPAFRLDLTQELLDLVALHAQSAQGAHVLIADQGVPQLRVCQENVGLTFRARAKLKLLKSACVLFVFPRR